MKNTKFRKLSTLLLVAMMVVGGSMSVHASTQNKTPDKKSEKVVVKNSRVKSVNKISPKKYTAVKHNGYTVYASNNKYYRKVNDKYIHVMPPFGLKVSLLPTHRTLFNFGNKVYYCAAGAIYQKLSSTEYIVVEPEVGMVVPELPEVNVREVSIDGYIYFEFDDIIYKQVPTTQGIQYEVVGSLSNM
ncbi:MAG: DUF6515 family protein [Rikenellaceae bacterium]